MAKSSNLFTTSQIVTRALHYANEDESKYRRFLQFAFEGIRELYRGVLRGEETWLKVTPNSINRVDFPQDMEEFIGIGIPFGGKIWFLTEDNRIIATFTTDDEGTLSLDSADGEGVNLPTTQYENIRATGGVNLYGYYKLDWVNREIIINANSYSELILVYKTSGIRTDAITYVPTAAADALVAYILWRDALGNVKLPSDITVEELRKREWQEERQKLKKREMFALYNIRDLFNSTKSLLRR